MKTMRGLIFMKKQSYVLKYFGYYKFDGLVLQQNKKKRKKLHGVIETLSKNENADLSQHQSTRFGRNTFIRRARILAHNTQLWLFAQAHFSSEHTSGYLLATAEP